jgi:hypothetical protein
MVDDGYRTIQFISNINHKFIVLKVESVSTQPFSFHCGLEFFGLRVESIELFAVE